VSEPPERREAAQRRASDGVGVGGRSPRGYYDDAAMPPWRTLLGDYPATRALREGRVTSPALSLDLADVPVPHKAFKRVVRDLEFDVAELALMTFLMARSRGVPLRLLPVALFARNPLTLLVHRVDRGPLSARGLEGRRVAARAYTTTTAVWARALLADQFGVDLEKIQWATFEEGHVAGVQEPPNVHRDPAHADLAAMLLDGAVDAALIDPVPNDDRVARVVPGCEDVWCAWQRSTGARTVNHVVVVRESLAADADRIRELLRLFRESSEMADRSAGGSFSMGMDGIRRSLEVAIAAAEAQHLLARGLTVSDLVL
jgi:4,5-dihydroxyphthalate decarboxylase